MANTDMPIGIDHVFARKYAVGDNDFSHCVGKIVHFPACKYVENEIRS